MAGSTHEYDLFMAYCQGQTSLGTWYLRACIQLMGTVFAQLKCVSYSFYIIPENSSILPFSGT